MKIAMVAPLLVPVPPVAYGGIERVVDELARGLAKRGHEITLFCCGGSTISGEHITRVETTPRPTVEDLAHHREMEIAQLQEVLRRQHEFDLIHFHYEPLIFRLEDGSFLIDQFTTPLVCTFHNLTTIPENIAAYREATNVYRHQFVFISESHRRPLSFLPKSMVIYNGLPLENFRFEPEKGDSLLFLGRITEMKGILDAIEVSRQTKVPLIIAAKVDPADRDFYENRVKHLIDGELVRYVGEVGFEDKVRYLGKAKALLFPIHWEEPFGLVMVEALACGTPVIAYRKGSVPEIVQDGVTGCVVDTLEGMVEAVKRVQNFSPQACRESVIQRFSTERMVGDYDQLYHTVLRG